MSSENTGWSALLAGGNGARSIALAGGVALHAVNVFVATTILPSVVKEIGGIDYYAWNTTVFVVASIIGSALATRVLSASGPRRAYVLAALIFAIGTTACALAPSMPALLVARAVQGAGGGVLLALTYAMIRIVYSPGLWPRAMALVSGMWGVATLIGPALGGIFAELDAWRAAFWSMLPLTGLFALLAWQALPRDGGPRRTHGPLPLLQLGVMTASVLALSVASTRSSPAEAAAGVALAFALLAALILCERSGQVRLFPRGSFSPGSALAALFGTMSLLSIGVTSNEVFIPLFLQVLHDQSPLFAGYIAALMAAGWTVGSICSSGVRRASVPRVILLGPVLSACGMVILAVLMPAPSHGALLLLAPMTLGLALVGFGVGFAWPHLLTAVLHAAPEDEADLASASITTVQLFTAALGSALAGMVVNFAGLTSPGGVAGTASAAFWLFTLFTLAPLLALLAIWKVARRMRAT